MPLDYRNRPNRSEEYRQLAEQARRQAAAVRSDEARKSFLRVAETWEQMAAYEDKGNAPLTL